MIFTIQPPSTEGPMKTDLSQTMMEEVAQKFRVLSDPMRLRILHFLQDGELTVTELVERTESSQPNISKHLATLRNAGLVQRRRESNQAYFSVSAPFIFELCEIVCSGINEEIRNRQAMLQQDQAR